jgi:hypothetical protein
MIYINAILVMIIAFQIVKLYSEYKQMNQGRNTKKVRAIDIRPSASQLQP